jgi:hypothetical protein
MEAQHKAEPRILPIGREHVLIQLPIKPKVERVKILFATRWRQHGRTFLGLGQEKHTTQKPHLT